MSGCCAPPGYDRLFGERAARRDARRYRRHGLDATAEEMVAFVSERGIRGGTVLEVGGGVGAIEIELLKAGASRAVNVELSAAYDSVAEELARDAGVADRIERRHGDFAAGDSAEPADVVLMHRVICCYPDPDSLVGAAAEKSRRLLVLSFPRESWFVRFGLGATNLWFRRSGFHAYVHPVAAIIAAAERAGLRPVFEHRGRFWQVAALQR